jgi:hypothetical protein
MMFDSEGCDQHFICLFGIYMFDFPIICRELIPHGRFASIDPREKGRLTLTENMTRYQGNIAIPNLNPLGLAPRGMTIPSILPRYV